MSILASLITAWLIEAFVASAAAWLFYLGLQRLRVTASTRYLYLRIMFILVPLIPFLLRFLPWRLAVTEGLLSSAATSEVIPETLLLSTLPSLAHSNYFVSLLYVALSAYLLKLVFCFIKLGFASQKLRRVIETAKLQVFEGFNHPIFVHDFDVPPAIIGLIWPKILIPKHVYEGMTRSNLRMILRHEETHLKRWDHLWNWSRVLVLSLLWFSPFMRTLATRFEEEMELSCDEFLFESQEFSRKDYGNLLLSLLSEPYSAPSVESAGVFMSNALVSRRIHAMKTKTERKKPVLAILLTLSAFVVTSHCLVALAIDAKIDSVMKVASDEKKDFNLTLGASLASGTSKEAQKSQVALNANESGSMQIGGVEVRVTPSFQGSMGQVTIELLEVKTGTVLRKSILPLKDRAGISVNLTQPVKQKIAVKVTRL